MLANGQRRVSCSDVCRRRTARPYVRFFLLTPLEIRTRTTFDSEGFGLVYLEAGACGKPSIASTTAGCSEAVADGWTGLLVPPHSAPQLARAIRCLIDDPILRRRLGKNAHRRIHASGGWSAVARTLSQSYARIVQMPPDNLAPVCEACQRSVIRGALHIRAEAHDRSDRPRPFTRRNA